MESMTRRMEADEHSREGKGISGFLSRFVSYKRGSPSFAAIEADTSRPALTAQHPKNRRWSIATGLDARAKMAATISKDQEQANQDSAAATDTTLNDPASTMPATPAVLAKVAASVITPLQAGSQSLRRKRRTAIFASPECKLSRVEVLQNIEEKTEPSSTPSGKSQDGSSRSQKTGQGGDEKRPVSTRSNTQSPPPQSYLDDGNGGEKPNPLRLDLGQPLVPSSDDRKDDVSPERVKCDVGVSPETHQASGAPSGDETAVPSTPRPIGLPRRSAVRHTRSVSTTTDPETHKPTKSLAEGLPVRASLCQEQKERTKSEGGTDATSQLPRVVCVTFPTLDGNLRDSKVKAASENATQSLQTQNGAGYHAVLPESSKLGDEVRNHCPSAALESLADIQELRVSPDVQSDYSEIQTRELMRLCNERSTFTPHNNSLSTLASTSNTANSNRGSATACSTRLSSSASSGSKGSRPRRMKWPSSGATCCIVKAKDQSTSISKRVLWSAPDASLLPLQLPSSLTAVTSTKGPLLGHSVVDSIETTTKWLEAITSWRYA